ncbi:MAG TPA: START-like domain-containing protein [Bacteroidia bacterium]|nr:START-like domain-containing protein [Bacteroidia bacterium]
MATKSSTKKSASKKVASKAKVATKKAPAKNAKASPLKKAKAAVKTVAKKKPAIKKVAAKSIKMKVATPAKKASKKVSKVVNNKSKKTSAAKSKATKPVKKVVKKVVKKATTAKAKAVNSAKKNNVKTNVVAKKSTVKPTSKKVEVSKPKATAKKIDTPKPKAASKTAVINDIPLKPVTKPILKKSVTDASASQRNIAIRAKYKKVEIEYPVHSAKHILFSYLSTSSGLSEWFADKVNEKGDIMIFEWDGAQQAAKVLSAREDHHIRFRWLDMPEAIYFEFRVETDDITGDLALIITDFCEDDSSIESTKNLWNSQVDKLFHVLGIH